MTTNERIAEIKEHHENSGKLHNWHSDVEFLLSLVKKYRAALEFYATLKDRNRNEPFLPKEFGCGCCAKRNDKDGMSDYDSDEEVQGFTARQALAEEEPRQ